MTLASTSTSAPAVAGKKSFFKRPAWATQAPPAESRDFFRHSDAVYESILQDKARRREKHAQRKQAKSKLASGQDERESKRRRTSTPEAKPEEEDGDSEGTGSSESYPNQVNENKDEAAEAIFRGKVAIQPARPDSSQRANPLTKEPSKQDCNIIEAESDSGSIEGLQQKAKQTTRRAPSDAEVSEEEDEYVLELKRKARERARLKKAEKEAAGPHSGAVATAPQRQPSLISSSHNRKDDSKPPPESGAPQRNETIVQILITTSIPNANPLLVNRKVSQPMRQVREVWCARQNFDDEMTAKILFTWRGKRLYDTSTSTHLLNVLKSERARKLGFLADDDDDDDDEQPDPSEGRIEIQAMTKEMFEQQRSQKEQRAEAGQDPHGDTTNHGRDANHHDHQEASPSQTPTPAEPEYRVTMNAQGAESLQLKVRPSTAISKIMCAYRKMGHIDPARTCWLVFDGDRLEPDSRVADTEIEDGDALEVHVR